ncbi:hypothetical protein ABTM69_19890, partial [Acinetobacter baumannii]
IKLTGLHAGKADLIAWNDAIEASFKEAGQALRFLVEGSVLTMFQYAFHHAVEHAMMNDDAFRETLLAGLRTAFVRLADRLDHTVADTAPTQP